MNDDETRKTAISYARTWALQRVKKDSIFDDGQPGILDVEADIEDGKVLDISARDVFPYFQSFVDASMLQLKKAGMPQKKDVSRLYGMFRRLWEEKSSVQYDAFHVLTQKPAAKHAVKYPCFGLQCEASCYVVFDVKKLKATLVTS